MELACRKNNNEEMVRLLLANGANKDDVSDKYNNIIKQQNAQKLQIEIQKSARLAEELDNELEHSKNLLLCAKTQATVRQAIKMNFKKPSKQNIWKNGRDYTVYQEPINSGGSYNLGVYKIDAHCDDASGTYALKIVLNLVDTTVRNMMYGNPNSDFHTNLVKNRQSAEHVIPADYAHPLFVMPTNSWIGDINDLAEQIPKILNLKKSLIDTNACVVSRTSFLVMPLYEKTLSNFFNQTTPEIKAYIIFQLLEVLSHLQENFVIHSDFRGDNILVIRTNDNDIKSVRIGLADFGLAKALCHRIIIPDRKVLVEFKQEMNPNYLPPELKDPKFNGINDAWSICYGMDIWSCGLTILELYKGDLNVTATIKSAKTKIDSEREVSSAIRSLADNMPPPVQEICRLLLSVDPKGRNLQQARMIAGNLCWPNIVDGDKDQLKQAKEFLATNPYSTDLLQLLKLKFMSEKFMS